MTAVTRCAPTMVGPSARTHAGSTHHHNLCVTATHSRTEQLFHLLPGYAPRATQRLLRDAPNSPRDAAKHRLRLRCPVLSMAIRRRRMRLAPPRALLLSRRLGLRRLIRSGATSPARGRLGLPAANRRLAWWSGGGLLEAPDDGWAAWLRLGSDRAPARLRRREQTAHKTHALSFRALSSRQCCCWRRALQRSCWHHSATIRRPFWCTIRRCPRLSSLSRRKHAH